MHCSYFSDRIYVEKTSEQCYLSYNNSQKTKEGVWWDRYSSKGQVLKQGPGWSKSIGWRWSKRWYIMWKTLHEVGIGKNKEKKTVANLNYFCIHLWLIYTRGTSSDWKYIKIKSLICVWQSFKLSLSVVQFIRA